MPKKQSVTTVSPFESEDYLAKGTQFLGVMRLCLEDREWDAVLLNGTHAAISLNDALCSRKLGKRSTGESHQGTVNLLKQACPTEEGKKNARRLQEVLSWKNLVEYESRRITEDEARKFSTQVHRLADWIKTQISKME